MWKWTVEIIEITARIFENEAIWEKIARRLKTLLQEMNWFFHLEYNVSGSGWFGAGNSVPTSGDSGSRYSTQIIRIWSEYRSGTRILECSKTSQWL